ncbi:ABC transporter ATP-binding protein [Corynebacterium ureicelerivorans]|uniref:ABC transporter ATP-binding protein n=1 Tax=Corynebacterium ureicelerivorans TaxID=401472 RepID=UPI002656E3AC|nr:ABC transporter ATP-binding protein [Corynebacterium ureicelerivorans]MDN8604628.1 ABC transporter ATP-binding protein [Corynebacterium ureicelerivorans]
MAIRADNLTVSYGRTTILHSLSFGPLEPGKVVGLIGPNAAGKSTLVKTIAGIKEPAEGSVTLSVDGAELVGKQKVQAVGYVPQDLLSSASLTAFESIMVSARRRGDASWNPLDRSAAVMERLGITHLADRLVSDMSGGQRQLVAMAQMLVREPDIMLLDEPTSALDLRHQVELLQIVCEEVHGSNRLALVAIHDLNLAARYCDELLVVKAGRVVAHDIPHAVLQPDLLEEVYGIRARVLDDGGVPVVCPV